MKIIIQVLTASYVFLFYAHISFAQDTPVYPTGFSTPVAFEITKPLRDNPVLTPQEINSIVPYNLNHQDREINLDLTPPDFDNMPLDPGKQTFPGWIKRSKAILPSFKDQENIPDNSSSVYTSQSKNTKKKGMETKKKVLDNSTTKQAGNKIE